VNSEEKELKVSSFVFRFRVNRRRPTREYKRL
jgi:hypothetical protein